MDIVVFIIGILLVLFSLTINASNNALSRLVFKASPFFMGLFLMYYAANAMGWVNV